jgi:hypothetical protein
MINATATSIPRRFHMFLLPTSSEPDRTGLTIETNSSIVFILQHTPEKIPAFVGVQRVIAWSSRQGECTGAISMEMR